MGAKTTGTRDGGRLRWALPLALAGIVTEGVAVVRASLERLGHDKAGRARLAFVVVVCVAVATLVRATALYGPVVVVGALAVGGLLARNDLGALWGERHGVASEGETVVIDLAERRRRRVARRVGGIEQAE